MLFSLFPLTIVLGAVFGIVVRVTGIHSGCSSAARPRPARGSRRRQGVSCAGSGSARGGARGKDDYGGAVRTLTHGSRVTGGARGQKPDVASARYRAALGATLRSTAAAYGYTLTVGTTLAELTTAHGSPHAADLFLFALGGLVAFAVLELLLRLLPEPAQDSPSQAFPLAGVLNFVAVSGGLGAGLGLSQALSSDAAWPLAGLGATATYMLLVAAQVTLVTRWRG